MFAGGTNAPGETSCAELIVTASSFSLAKLSQVTASAAVIKATVSVPNPTIRFRLMIASILHVLNALYYLEPGEVGELFFTSISFNAAPIRRNSSRSSGF